MLFYYYLLLNGLVLFCISIFRIKKNPATKYFFLQYIILLLLITEFITILPIFERFSWWCYSDFPVRFLLSPFAYLYVCTYTNPHYRPSVKTNMLLFLPALIELICFIALSVHYYKHPHTVSERPVIANTSLYYYVRTSLSLVFNLTCIILAYQEIKSFTWNIFRVLSSYKTLRFNWMKVILGIAIVLWIYWFTAFGLEVFWGRVEIVKDMYFSLYLLIALVVLVFGYFAVLRPYVPEPYLKVNSEIASIDKEEHTVSEPMPEPAEAEILPLPGTQPIVETKHTHEKMTEGGKPEKNLQTQQLDKQHFQKWFNRLEMYINKEKTFTNPEITLTDIANKLGTSSFTISKAIKLFSKEGSFYEYINRYRILYFIDLLADKESEAYTIQSLAYKSGLTSTSTLSKYCKKLTGSTPAKLKTLLQTGKKPAEILLS
jgi:AraC-like DNA-binding protein